VDSLTLALGKKPDDATLLARRANLLARSGQTEAAAADYRQLARIEPRNATWPLRLKQLHPDVFAFWDFTSGTGGWRTSRDVRRTPAEGALRVEGAGDAPSLVLPLHASAGWKKLTLRACRKGAVNAKLYWRSIWDQEFTEWLSLPFSLWGGEGELADSVIYFIAFGKIRGLRLDPILPDGSRWDVESITLADVTSQADFDRVRAQFDRASEEPSEEVKSFFWRGFLYAYLGQYDRAAADYARGFARETTWNPYTWFEYANLILQVGDTAGY
jgi:tetratricopeptide (TPR) repeat protein